MNSRFSLFSILLIAVTMIFSGCSNNDFQRLYPAEDWLYSTEQDENIALASGFQNLSKEDFSSLYRLIDNKSGFIWLKYNFMLPKQLKNRDLSLYAGRISMADIAYINGIQIGSAGVMPPEKEFSAWNETRCYHIPSSILNEYSNNELILKIWTHGEGSISNSIFIGTTQDAKSAAKTEQFLNSTLTLMCALCMIVIGLYSIIFYFFRHNDREYLYFSILNIVAAAYLSVWYIQDLFELTFLPFSFINFQKVMSGFMVFILASILIEFVNAYVHRKEHKSLKIIRYALIIIPAVLIFSQKDYTDLRNIQNVLHILMIPFIAYILFTIIRSIIIKRDGAVSLTIGFIPFIICLTIDMIPHTLPGYAELPFLSTYSWMVVIMSFLVILARRFVKARNEAEDLNINLEKKVETRTKELSLSNENLEKANAELEQINQRAQQDMNLAISVQRNFYAQKAPSVDGWEIAYTFRPMAGVSGDLYDFFHKDRTFKGCCLFDVSGHGISSGLVTMLSKNIIMNEFENGQNDSLTTVMDRISTKIGTDKGQIENYLTGILLRINGSKVEYVNGGHPALLCKSGTSGKVVPAQTKKQSSGSLIGIPYLPTEFSGITFDVKSGDSLLLYTDCLYESRNAQGEELGAEGVKNIFAKCSSGSASSQLESLLELFNQHTKDVPLTDDLTVILLKKL